MPGPSCPYDRAGRRGALPFFGKLQPWRAGPGPGWGRSSAAKQQAARRGPLERTAASRQLPRPPGPGFWLPYCFYSRAEAPRCFKSCFWGCSALRGKVKAAHPIARRRTLSYPHAGERERWGMGVSQQLVQAQCLPGWSTRSPGSECGIIPTRHLFLAIAYDFRPQLGVGLLGRENSGSLSFMPGPVLSNLLAGKKREREMGMLLLVQWMCRSC